MTLKVNGVVWSVIYNRYRAVVTILDFFDGIEEQLFAFNPAGSSEVKLMDGPQRAFYQAMGDVEVKINGKLADTAGTIQEGQKLEAKPKKGPGQIEASYSKPSSREKGY